MKFNIFQLNDDTLTCKFSYKNVDYFAILNSDDLLVYTIQKNSEDFSKTGGLIVQKEINDFCIKKFKNELESFCVSLDEIESKEMQKVFILEIGRRYDDAFQYTFYTGSRNIEYANPKKKYAVQEIYIDNWDRTINVERSYHIDCPNEFIGPRRCETFFIDTSLEAVIEAAFKDRRKSIEYYKNNIKQEEERIKSNEKYIENIEEEISKVESCKNSIIFKKGIFELRFPRKK